MDGVSFAGSYAPSGVVNTAAVPLLDEMLGEVESANKQLSELTKVARAIAESTLGPRTENSASGGLAGSAPPDSCRADRIRRSMSSLRGAISDLAFEIARLRGI